MKFTTICTIFFLLASVSAIIAIPNSSWKRHEDDKGTVTTDESHTSLINAHKEGEGAATVIGVIQIVIALDSWITSLSQGQTMIAEPDPNQPQTGAQLIRASIKQLETNNRQSGSPFTGIAIRFGVPTTSINWDGFAGQDWGLNMIIVDNAIDGSSMWRFYWCKTGSITITTGTPSHDVGIGILQSFSTSPTDPYLRTIHLIKPPSTL
ncbi:hypothetical protein BYT27DRAFT_7203111 [Phlegmacium glaucopus]|nr:hypothetical protein BYT27DRAFT_7203111 [Phlegmacium glaucopus]